VKVDILNLEWASSGRDREMATLVNFALRKKGYRVREASIFDWRHELLKYDPKLLFITNSNGAKINFRVVKFAKQHGYSVVTLTSEGNLEEIDIEISVWGRNTDRKLYEDITCYWTKRAKEICLSNFPDLDRKKIKVTGAAGFDRYKIYRFMSKNEFLDRYNKNYKKIVGVAGWGFDHFDKKFSLYETYENIYGKKQCQTFRSDRLLLNEIYEKLIKNNRSVLFLLKEHPGVINKHKSELHGLDQYDNVVYIKSEEKISNCISPCDIWIAYESTTCLEAWLLGKETFYVNPSGPDFQRRRIYLGHPVFETYKEAQNALNAYYERGSIPEFKARKDLRKKIISDVIQWDDGKNHMRAAYFIEKILKEADTNKLNRYSLKEKFDSYVNHILYIGAIIPGIRNLPRFKKYKYNRRMFKSNQLKKLTKEYQPFWERFFETNPLTIDDKREIINIS